MHPKILSAGLSDVGQKRENNQDHFLIADLHRSLLLLNSNLSLQCPMRVHGDGEARLMLVADGMGGIKLVAARVSELWNFVSINFSDLCPHPT